MAPIKPQKPLKKDLSKKVRFEGVATHSFLFTAYHLPLFTPFPLQGICTVSTKVFSSAVKRNQLKRRCKSIIYKHNKETQHKRAVVVIFKKDSNKASFQAISQELAKIFKGHQ